MTKTANMSVFVLFNLKKAEPKGYGNDDRSKRCGSETCDTRMYMI